MSVLGFDRIPLVPVLAALALLPLGVQGQLRTVISNEIAVSEREASLSLGFQDGESLSVVFRGGQVLVEGEPVGSYQRRDGLDLAWRSLLGEVITLDDGPLAERLKAWDPPENLSGDDGRVASRLDEILEEALAPRQLPEEAALNEAPPALPESGAHLLEALLTRTGSLGLLSEALEGASLDRLLVRVGEDVEVGPGERVEGTLILVDGDLRVEGEVDGDVILTNGTIRLEEDGLITGDLRIADGRLESEGGTVSGSVIEVTEGRGPDREELETLRRELESEIRRDLRASSRRESRQPALFMEVLGNVGSAIAGILENLVTFLVLAVLGVLAVHFQRERMEILATTARRAPVRSAVVGLAGGFFILPVWIVGIIALAITIIGIPVLLAWVPLFPIAAGLAILLGFLAVARNVGEWVAEQEYRGLEWIRGSNMFYTVVAGLAALMLPAVAANASKILGFGFLTGLLGFLGSMVTFAAAAIGLGAVLLTRGGKIRPMESYYDFQEDYWADTGPRRPHEPSPGPGTTPQDGPVEGEESGAEESVSEGEEEKADDAKV